MNLWRFIEEIRDKWRARYDRINHRFGSLDRSKTEDLIDAHQLGLIRDVRSDLEDIADRIEPKD